MTACHDDDVLLETEDNGTGPVDPRSVTPRAARPPLDARPSRGLGSWPVIAFGIVLTALGAVVTWGNGFLIAVAGSELAPAA